MPASRKKRATSSSKKADAAAAPAADDDTATTPSPNEIPPPSLMDKAVVAYLKEKGLDHAVLELQKILLTRDGRELTPHEQVQLEDAAAQPRTKLGKATGGGYGYDLDAAKEVPLWGVPDVRTVDEEDTTKEGGSKPPVMEQLGRQEARAYLDSFTALQLWVLSLPDDPVGNNNAPSPVLPEGMKTNGGISIASVVQHAASGDAVPASLQQDLASLHASSKTSSPILPPSTKPELLAVTFALLVHTYTELLDVGMESAARILLDTFQSIYEPLYPTEVNDLRRCTSSELMSRVLAHTHTHMDAVQALRHVMMQVASYQLKRDEVARHVEGSGDQQQQQQRRLAEYEKQLTLMQQKYEELSKKATLHYEKNKEFPFLRRARGVRWQLSISAQSYSMLAAFLSSESLLPMSALLHSKCEVYVERRDPVPFTPPCVLDDTARSGSKQVQGEVQWAAPVAPAARVAERGDEINEEELQGVQEKLPFPPLHLEEEYETKQEARLAKSAVEFNRALLTNGFRRLEAIERKRDYEVGFRSEVDGGGSDMTTTKPPVLLADPLKPSILLSTLCSSESAGKVLGSGPTRFGAMDATAIWEESGVNITCAKMCPPDGRRIAAGCDDAAIRIWSLLDSSDAGGSKKSPVSETAMVLLGHKNGFPVFDVNWNRDGRSLLSAGGDGSIRLWDTLAVGPYGKTTRVTRFTTTAALDKVSKEEDGTMAVPGLRPKSSADTSGAALSVYRGHAPSCPVWSVEFAPSGYYFASAASDATARIWTTDRPSPIRVLSGHTSASVNTITWHPNCNYVLTGANDKTVRMWDIHSGRCVRLLGGCGDGINVVRVSPSGKYAAGADASGIIHIWDLGQGKKVDELRPDPNAGSKRDATGFLRPSSSMIHSMSYSACGMALATGGDDRVVRIWDTRGVGNDVDSTGPSQVRPGTRVPTKSFPTRRTSMLDLQYTKRNLLLACGKYATEVPLATPIGD